MWEVYSGGEEYDCVGGVVPVDVAAIAFAVVDAEAVEAAVAETDGRRQAVVAILRAPWSLPL
jgi:hypothetical protein